ncbi:MAG: adenylate/guanylate cyclase domain-containing protein [Pseudomonadota bacterium]
MSELRASAADGGPIVLPVRADGRGRRIPVSAIVTLGFGALVAVAVGLVLLVGIGGATKNTSVLLQDKGETVVAQVERDIRARLSPVMSQAQAIASAFSRGDIGLDDLQRLDAYMFGALAGTPQISGIAIVQPSAVARRWGQREHIAVQDDWSDNPGVVNWLKEALLQTESTWRPPFWTDALNSAVVMLDTPLTRNGQVYGMLAQVVPIAELSQTLTDMDLPVGFTPFVLHQRDRLLAHPDMVTWVPPVTGAEVPLPALAEFSDAALKRIWTPDEDSIFILRDMQGVAAAGAEIDDDFHIYLHRELSSFGDWTVGVYFNTALTGSDEYNRLVRSLWTGLAVLLVSVLITAQAGRALSHPVQQLAEAAVTVQSAGLDAAPRVAGSRVRELDDAARAFNQMVIGLRERELIRRTLGRFVPEKIAQSLLSAGGELAVARSQATILFCDVEGFTALTEEVGPNGIMTLLNEYFEDMVSILERHNGVVTQFQGDAILATFNVPAPDYRHAANALRSALEMQGSVQSRLYAGRRVSIRIGINTGSVVAGAVGASGRLSYTVHGDAVNLAARLESLNKELGTRILVSGHTAALVDEFELLAAGETVVRGQTTPIALYELKGIAES